MTIKYPEVQVNLSGQNGNAFAILGAVSKAMRRAGLKKEAEDFYQEATSSDYDHLLQTAMKTVDVS